MRTSARHRRLPDERARRHPKRLEQAGTADAAVNAGPVDNADSGFSLTGPITITVFVPPTDVPPPPVTTPTTTPQQETTPPPPPPPPPPATTSTTSSPPPPATTSSNPNSGNNGNGTGAGAGNGTGGGNGNATPQVSVVPPGQSAGAGASNGAPTANGAISNNKGLGTGAIVGIVIAILVVLIAAAVFFLRRKNIFSRRKRRATWLAKGGIMGPKPISGYDSFLPTTSEKPPPPPVPNGGGFGGGGGGQSRYSYAPGATTEAVAFSYANNTDNRSTGYATLAPPPSSYNNPPVPPPSSMPGAPVNSNGLTATVVCGFEPSLPDELSIESGEVIRILVEFDDGWASCMNSRNEKGMVPLECLDRSTSSYGVGGGQPRDSRRASSLATGFTSNTGGPPLAPNRLYN